MASAKQTSHRAKPNHPTSLICRINYYGGLVALRDEGVCVGCGMSEIPREMIEERALQIAREEGRGNVPTHMDLMRAEDMLRAELDPARNERVVPDVETPAKSGEGLDPKDNPAPPPH